MDRTLLLRALCSYRKKKIESLKSNERHGRTNCVKVRKLQIEMIDEEIKLIEAYEPAEAN
jgi:hypothetical protein